MFGVVFFDYLFGVVCFDCFSFELRFFNTRTHNSKRKSLASNLLQRFIFEEIMLLLLLLLFMFMFMLLKNSSFCSLLMKLNFSDKI